MTSDELLPGYSIGAISAASGLPFHEAALGVASIIGNIAGPAAGLEGPAGDLIHPGLNVIVTGRDSAAWRRAEQLLIEPVTACQKMFRDLSKDTTPARLDHLQFSSINDPTKGIVNRSKEGLFADPGASTQYLGASRAVEVMRTPTFFLRSPDAITLAAALPQVLDGCPFLHYGAELFANLLEKRPSKQWLEGGPQLAAAVCGHDQHFERNKRCGPSDIDVVKANLLVTATRQQLKDALGANDAVQRILHNSVILDPSGTTPGARPEMQKVRHGYQIYYNTIKEVLDARSNGSGFQLVLKPEMSGALHEFTEELNAWCKKLPQTLQPFFSRALSLPYQLHWAFTATLHPRESDTWVLPFTVATTRELLDRQKQLLEALTCNVEADAQHRARATMLWKLADKPLSLRDLLRRYGNQRRELHEPVLQQLIRENLVAVRPDGLLELEPLGRGYLAA